MFVDWKTHLLVEYSKSTFACQLLDSQVWNDRYKAVDDIIYYTDRVYLEPKLKMKEKILREVHYSPLVRHPRSPEICMKIWEKFTWKGLKDDVM